MKHRQRGSINKSIVIVLLVVMVGAAAGYFGAKYFGNWFSIMKSTNTGFSDILKHKKDPFEGKEFVRILILGADNSGKSKSGKKTNNQGLSDTIVVMCINTKTKEIRAISFPRDTMVDIDGHGTSKLNAAHRFGGPELTQKVLEKNFLYPMTIDYYIKTDTQNFRNMVDELGGVYLVVEKNMKYTDRSQNLYINLKGSPEKQLLNGEEAEGYVRFRHDLYGDSGYTMENGEKVSAGRIVRQQKFMVALCNRVISMDSRTKRAEFIKKCYEKKYIVSNLNLNDWDALSDFFTGIKPEEMLIDVLPGEPKTIHGASYWVSDPTLTTSLVNKNMLFEGENQKLGSEQSSNSQDIKKSSKTPGEYKITILNGTGIKGKASELAEQLKKIGYLDITTDNADNFNYTVSEIIPKDKSDRNVKKIKSELNFGKLKKTNTSQSSDMVIIIGKDYLNK